MKQQIITDAIDSRKIQCKLCNVTVTLSGQYARGYIECWRCVPPPSTST